jgi:hypothetical protein
LSRPQSRQILTVAVTTIVSSCVRQTQIDTGGTAELVCVRCSRPRLCTAREPSPPVDSIGRSVDWYQRC